MSNFLFISCIYVLSWLCVPVKMSVGTETEKFWESLWEPQAECTGLLWVERHPWARGDLGQSARREREEDVRPILDTSSEKGPNPNVARKPREEERDAHNRTTGQHCNRVKKETKEKEKNRRKRGWLFPAPSLCLDFI